MHVDINSHKLKVDQKNFEWGWSKMLWSVWSQDSKIDCISKMNRWNELFFLHAGANSGSSYKSFPWFFSGRGQKWAWPFGSWGPRAHFSHADCDAIILVRPTLYSISLTFKWQCTAIVLNRTWSVAGRIPWNRVCLSFHPVVCLDVFFKLDH